jgi:hypothetical protein
VAAVVSGGDGRADPAWKNPTVVVDAEKTVPAVDVSRGAPDVRAGERRCRDHGAAPDSRRHGGNRFVVDVHHRGPAPQPPRELYPIAIGHNNIDIRHGRALGHMMCFDVHVPWVTWLLRRVAEHMLRGSLGERGRCSGSQASQGFVRHRFRSECGLLGRRAAAAG